MNRQKFYDLFFGKISFEAKDGFPELFLKECTLHGVQLNDVSLLKNGYRACIKYADRKDLLASAEKSGMEITLTGRYGIPAVFFRYKRRYGIPLGLFLFLIVVAVLSSVLWSIEITGISVLREEDIFEMLEDYGVKCGTFTEGIDCDELEYRLSQDFDDILWVSVYVAGSRMFVDIKEVQNTVEYTRSGGYYNIVASKNGEIVRADILQGDGSLQPGTAVAKGDLLVSGVVTMREGNVKFVEAQADVFAKTKNVINTYTAQTIDVYRITECKDRYLLYFFGMELPLGAYDKGNDFTETRYLFDASDVILPLGIIRRNYMTTEKASLQLSDEACALIAFTDLSKASFVLYESTEVKDRTIMPVFNKRGASMEGVFDCIENIAEKKEFTVELSGDDKKSTEDSQVNS